MVTQPLKCSEMFEVPVLLANPHKERERATFFILFIFFGARIEPVLASNIGDSTVSARNA